jgi:hypothetical protein
LEATEEPEKGVGDEHGDDRPGEKSFLRRNRLTAHVRHSGEIPAVKVARRNGLADCQAGRFEIPSEKSHDFETSSFQPIFV